ncbi:oxidoreductase [Mycolicibacterium duvalii]|uniref:Oxidoreductase n=1 Tax=Mycolicibacterium duvalii TaxID=39688 RepID=A0A7I7K2K9_9MYCO|nr:molybdopterin-dependent oxidoreductase [Mycolicibacterium duvalii]MCV7369881.1 molybdopterin-dependent oxidoreductase [Mycolicibacterium duvalii]PEG35778.1 oxidoreductase [Mycolicibacterium duvalii]BBX17612.1 oxidoreductase [Mycolicibacterium duvalii]
MTTLGARVLGGVAAAATAVGVAGLTAVAFGPEADVRTAVGSSVIELTPGPVKEWAIQTLGTANKSVLTIAVLIVVALLAAVAGAAERPRRPVGSAMIVAAAVLGCAAVLSRPNSTAVDVLPTLIGAACGVAVLRYLTSPRRVEPDAPDAGRRASLLGLGFLAAGTVSGVAGVVLTRLTTAVTGDREAFALPAVDEPAAPIPPSVQPAGVQLPSFVTSNADFYRIDTALTVPQLSRADWQLRIHGMVDREITYRFDDLDEFEVVEEVVTLTCVSNPVGGDLVSNAVWTGYRVRDLLARAGVSEDADMVLSQSVDGWTAGTPIDALTGADALLAVGMNGEPLPVEHGYPARLVVPGLYGYVSATKWVVDLEVTRFDRAQAYWTRLGWAERGPIKTASRVDVPRAGQDVPVGPTVFGGVAWAQNRGIRTVEVRIDDGPWQPATLGDGYSGQTWRMWSFDWEARDPGLHTISVRATDNTGYTQTSERVDPVPDGATGWHTITFAVR